MASSTSNGSDGNAEAKSDKGKAAAESPSSLQMVLYSLYFMAIFQGFYYAATMAYDIRLYAIKEYGRVIHEFDPYFNYRATEYLWAHGWHAFSHWYDDMVWYPLGRPVGTTIYPGMQVTSVAIKQYLLPDWSINDICCFVPAWFGSIATLGAAWLAYECMQDYKTFRTCLGELYGINWAYEKFVAPLLNVFMTGIYKITGSTLGLPHPYIRKPTPALECALWTALIMSIVPAHLLRSVAGGYDNESVATTAMVLTFAAWTRTLRETTHEWTTVVWGIIAGFCYFYMVAAWGGYVFVINLIGVHASLLFFMGRFSSKLHKGYTAFYFVGTILATRVPVVGWTPLKSLEQLGPFVAFVGIQLLEYCRRQEVQKKLNLVDLWKLRIRVFFMAGLVALVLVFFLAPTGYFGPFSSRIRGLFVKHTKTGNPLVDSVAEHQAASPSAYFQYLNDVCYLAPIGFGLVLLAFCNDSSSFLVVYGVAAYFFSHRMVRLILLTAPIASVLGGIALGHLHSWMVGSIFPRTPNAAAMWALMSEGDIEIVSAPPKQETSKKSIVKKDKKKGTAKATSKSDSAETTTESVPMAGTRDPYIVSAIRLALSVYIVMLLWPKLPAFYEVCDTMAQHISHPTIIQKARTKSGEEVKIDDYRDAYFWLRDNTPEDARVMAWWDYGYQITGIANRTTIADGNTWNHEHIALLGKTLTSPERDGHRVARHLADYILVWAGGGGDDLAKSPHLIRIANSVYRGLCSEPTCREFGYYSNGEPSERMAESMLYKLHSHRLKPGVEADPNRFKLVYQSRYGKVRIFKVLKVSKESKEWVADPKNKLCDAGGWLCRGQYPPALQKILATKKDFKQLEDFNIKGEDDSEYQKQYMENLLGGNKAPPPKKKKESGDKPQRKPKMTAEEIEMFNEAWENNELRSYLWELISQNKVDEFKELLSQNPAAAHVRSEDGRGPMWWAHEYKRTDIIEILRKLKVSEKRTDENGKTPLDL